jgi:hypothetical protein
VQHPGHGELLTPRPVAAGPFASIADDAALDRLAESLATMVWCTYEVG